MREQLFQRLLESSDRFAGELTELVLARVDELVTQANDAFEIALSAFASEIIVTDGAARLHDVRDNTRGNRRAAQPRSHARSEAREFEGSAPGSLRARVEEHDATAVADSSSERAADRGVSSYRALQQGKDLPPSTSTTKGKPRTRAVMKCKKCGELGKRSDSCGITHNVSTAPASADVEPSRVDLSAAKARAAESRPPASSSLSKPPPPTSSDRSVDRYALLEAAAAKRDAAKSAREQRAQSFVRPRGGPSRGVRRPLSADGAAEGQVGLPAPTATFDF